MVLDAAEVGPVLLRLDAVGEVLHAQKFAELRGVLGLVVLLVGKAHGEGLVHLGKAGHIAGIHAGGKEGAHLHVGNFVGGHALLHGGFDLVFPAGHVGAVVRLEPGLPVAAGGHFARFPAQPVGGQQFFDALEKGVLPRGILVGEVELQPLLVQLLHKAGMRQKAFYLAAKEQFALGIGVIIKGLDAEGIPGAEEALVRLVPDGKSKHAPQLFQHALAPLLVAVEQDFGVGMVGGEGVARRLQLGAQLHEVVNFAVEHHRQALILVEHGLAAALDVDDGEPPVAQGNAVAEIAARAVRPAVGDGVHHGFQYLFPVGAPAGKSHDPTHTVFVPFP